MIYINKEDVKRHLLASFFAESTGLATAQTSGLLRLTPFQPTRRGGPCNQFTQQ